MPRLLMVSFVCLLLSPSADAAAENPVQHVEVLVYGATPGGITAAVSAAKHGHSVLLLEPTSRIGGLMTNGLSHPDFRTFEAITGCYADLTDWTLQFYTDKYGPDSKQVKDCLRGTHPEPKLTEQFFLETMSAHPSIDVNTEVRLESLHIKGEGNERQISSATFIDLAGSPVTFTADIFIDGTYEGDLMAAAGVEYCVGREARDEYGESLAPREADNQVQGYNFRLTMTNVPENRVLPGEPAGYNREFYLGLLPLIEQGQIEKAFHITTQGSNVKAIYKAHDPVLPNGKFDINDMSRGNVRLSLPQFNNEWPDGDPETRRRIFDLHVRHNVGMLYFLQNDEAVPENIREGAREWGFCRDEFTESNHLPVQLYVREARRMVGRRVFTQQNVSENSLTDVRAIFDPDAIAMGDYGPNCHGTDHEGPIFGGQHTGEFYQRAAPYQIPYGAIVPKDVTNLLVPVAVSSSHVGFCALRLEPIWMSLGEAAGTAAHVSLEQQIPVQQVSPADTRTFLHHGGTATIYVSDVPRSSRDFAAVQWWGSLGGLHNLVARTGEYGERGEHFKGQYYHAFPGHAVELDKPLDDKLFQQWNALAKSHGVKVSDFERKEDSTRGDFIRTAFATVRRTSAGELGGRMNVMTWNIRYNNPGDGENAWPYRRDWVAEIIRRERVDIIGLQEVLQGQLDDLTQRLPEMEAYGVGRDDGKTKGEYAPILYRKDRFELLDKSTFWLSKTPDVPGSKDWDAALPRIASWVKLKDKQSGQIIYALNTHFDHVGHEARTQSAVLLGSQVQQKFKDHPVILTGDFNTRPGTDPYVTLTSPSKEPSPTFQDAKSVSRTDPTGPDSTWNGFRAIEPEERIDFIFVTLGLNVLSHQTLTDQKEGRFPSDHLPVKTVVK